MTVEKKYRPRCFLDIDIEGANAGRIIMELYSDICPETCENFRSLCTGEKGIGKTTKLALHYKGAPFHRVIKNFIIQSGDFVAGNGTGGESIYGGTFKDENFSIKHDKPFLLSMANRGKDTNGSQFFITTQPAPHLDGKHTVFGEVVMGEEVVMEIENQKTDQNSKPLKNVMINNCGELVLKVKQKHKKHKETDTESVETDSGEERKRKKRKHAKKVKKSRRERNEPSMEKNTGMEDCSLKPDEIPEIPTNNFLMRRSPPKGDGNRSRLSTRPTESYSYSRKPTVSRSGRRIKGRGFMRYRTPSPTGSRSGSETPPHWRQAQARVCSINDVMKKSQTVKEKGSRSSSPYEDIPSDVLEKHVPLHKRIGTATRTRRSHSKEDKYAYRDGRKSYEFDSNLEKYAKSQRRRTERSPVQRSKSFYPDEDDSPDRYRHSPVRSMVVKATSGKSSRGDIRDRSPRRLPFSNRKDSQKSPERKNYAVDEYASKNRSSDRNKVIRGNRDRDDSGHASDNRYRRKEKYERDKTRDNEENLSRRDRKFREETKTISNKNILNYDNAEDENSDASAEEKRKQDKIINEKAMPKAADKPEKLNEANFSNLEMNLLKYCKGRMPLRPRLSQEKQALKKQAKTAENKVEENSLNLNGTSAVDCSTVTDVKQAVEASKIQSPIPEDLDKDDSSSNMKINETKICSYTQSEDSCSMPFLSAPEKMSEDISPLYKLHQDILNQLAIEEKTAAAVSDISQDTYSNAAIKMRSTEERECEKEEGELDKDDSHSSSFQNPECEPEVQRTEEATQEFIQNLDDGQSMSPNLKSHADDRSFAIATDSINDSSTVGNDTKSPDAFVESSKDVEFSNETVNQALLEYSFPYVIPLPDETAPQVKPEKEISPTKIGNYKDGDKKPSTTKDIKETKRSEMKEKLSHSTSLIDENINSNAKDVSHLSQSPLRRRHSSSMSISTSSRSPMVAHTSSTSPRVEKTSSRSLSQSPIEAKPESSLTSSFAPKVIAPISGTSVVSSFNKLSRKEVRSPNRSPTPKIQKSCSPVDSKTSVMRKSSSHSPSPSHRATHKLVSSVEASSSRAKRRISRSPSRTPPTSSRKRSSSASLSPPPSAKKTKSLVVGKSYSPVKAKSRSPGKRRSKSPARRRSRSQSSRSHSRSPLRSRQRYSRSPDRRYYRSWSRNFDSRWSRVYRYSRPPRNRSPDRPYRYSRDNRRERLSRRGGARYSHSRSRSRSKMDRRRRHTTRSSSSSSSSSSSGSSTEHSKRSAKKKVKRKSSSSSSTPSRRGSRSSSHSDTGSP